MNRRIILATIIFVFFTFGAKAQSLNPTSHIWTSGTADTFNAGYTFAYATSGTPWNGALISYGGFPTNNYDTQISSDYGPNGGNHISFRTKNGDANIWNSWIELASKGENDFIGKQTISGNLGLGISNPLNKLHVNGSHLDSRILLHSEGGGYDVNQADLMLWASEPGLTYSGVGIGNNIHNYNNPNGGLKLLNTARGGSYIRLLDNSMSFNVVSSSGTDTQALSVNTQGNVGIGTITPNSKFEIYNTAQAGHLLLTSNDNPSADLTRIDLDFRVANQGHTVGRVASFYTDSGNGGSGGLRFYTRNQGSLVENVRINSIGNVGIGTINPNNKLDVNGTIHSKEVKVDMNGWSDFVFKKEYNLPTLEEVEKHIVERGHLENIPSEEEVVKNGINLGEMNAKLLQKIEELTLYVIEQNRRLEKVESENKDLRNQMNLFKKQ